MGNLSRDQLMDALMEMAPGETKRLAGRVVKRCQNCRDWMIQERSSFVPHVGTVLGRWPGYGADLSETLNVLEGS